MNLIKLFDTQAVLDEHIMQEHPELRGQNNLDWKLLALQVELGECANEWRGFKKWSKDQEPRVYKKETHYVDVPTDNPNWIERKDIGEVRNPLLEEYVDCLHFILSIGLEHAFNDIAEDLEIEPLKERDITQQFTALMRTDWEIYEEWKGGYYHEGLELFIGLGEMLGFTWEQVEDAYYAKNKVNHERQNAGY
ncbi:dUTP diphosphatase [Lysinibacillus sp. FSL W8-0992]|uniref:dUTP diphosphatase n=1 Tax=Lysinibacillus sp. FSL W8-0992 TaxID=2954643 RepID=UPI0030F7DE38